MSEKTNKMSFWDHLEELRWRIFKSLFAIIIGGIITYIYSDWVIRILVHPSDNIPIELNLQVLKVTSMFMVKLAVALMGGICVGLPVIVFQIWRFIEPAFEKSYTFAASSMVLFSTIFFMMGLSFGFFVIIPFSLNFFTSMTSEAVSVAYNFTLDGYLNYILWLLFACGLIFQLPVIVLFFARLELITTKSLRKYRKFVFLGFLIIAAFLTPPDPLSQILIVIPLSLLYEFSIFVAWLSIKGKTKKLPETA